MFKMANELGGELSSTVMRWIQESFYGASNLDSQSAAAAREIFGQNLASDAGMQYYHVNSEERRWIVLNHNDRVPDASLTILFLAAKNVSLPYIGQRCRGCFYYQDTRLLPGSALWCSLQPLFDKYY
eukprot:GHVU01096788.1.p4 GENE.GHVU01096788.1~~GHVU01096788.1.p4  ORF type:complete len:127 (-),score=11.11 GHVU01096788.1:2465-2845(-)